jgi:ribosomal protein S20
MSRMKSDMREADQAISQHDLQAADEYMERADREVGTLEKFLGH